MQHARRERLDEDAERLRELRRNVGGRHHPHRREARKLRNEWTFVVGGLIGPKTTTSGRRRELHAEVPDVAMICQRWRAQRFRCIKMKHPKKKLRT
ncbi:hypothetical protein OKW45_001050 [Paraburkholderia sp. WSM4175]